MKTIFFDTVNMNISHDFHFSGGIYGNYGEIICLGRKIT